MILYSSILKYSVVRFNSHFFKSNLVHSFHDVRKRRKIGHHYLLVARIENGRYRQGINAYPRDIN